MASLNLLYPPAGPLGYNMIVSGNTIGGAFASGDLVDGFLRRPGIANTVIRGTRVMTGGSNWNFRFTHHIDIGCDQGAAVDLTIEWHTALGVLVDSQLITGTYTNDSISGIGFQLAGGSTSHDPMLDDILACVRAIFPIY